MTKERVEYDAEKIWAIRNQVDAGGPVDTLLHRQYVRWLCDLADAQAQRIGELEKACKNYECYIKAVHPSSGTHTNGFPHSRFLSKARELSTPAIGGE